MRPRPNLTFSNLDQETDNLLRKMLHKEYIEINPGKIIAPVPYTTSLYTDILDMEVFESDVWMCSFPRTGSTWAQEMVWLIGHDLDYEGAKSLQQFRCPFVELSCLTGTKQDVIIDEIIKENSVDYVKYRHPHPRYIRSHLPWNVLPIDMERDDGSVKPKVVYIIRNPKDNVVSYYHHLTLIYRLAATFEEFCEMYMQNRVPHGSVWNHIFGFWNHRNDPNVLILKYEEMKKDLPSAVKKTAKFLGKMMTDEQVHGLCDYLSFQNMKTNKAVNLEPILEKTLGKSYLDKTPLRFIRKGEIGDWKNYMSDDLSKRFDKWAEEHLAGTGLSFDI